MKLISKLLTALLFVGTLLSHAQDVGGKTLVSQHRKTSVNIGKCEITISYHSPTAKGRKIFGGIVPFDFVVDGKEYPWRAGSNQRTTIEFSHPVEIEGQKLDSGSYGFVVLVSEKEWTLIFSSSKSWGAFSYDKANDVLRVPIKTVKTSHQEWLSYEFQNPTSESVDVQLRWEETAISFNVKTDALNNLLTDLTSKEDKNAADFQSLAIWTLEKNPNDKELALDYLEQSYPKIDSYESEYYQNATLFNYKVLKGELLIDMGQRREGEQLIEEALESASGFNTYYYALNKLLVKGEEKKALQLLKAQVKRDPENRANFLALGEFYLKTGNQEKATESFKKAAELSVGSPGENYTKYVYLQNKLILENSSQ